MDDLNRTPLRILENYSGFDSVFELNPFFSSINIFLEFDYSNIQKFYMNIPKIMVK